MVARGRHEAAAQQKNDNYLSNVGEDTAGCSSRIDQTTLHTTKPHHTTLHYTTLHYITPHRDITTATATTKTTGPPKPVLPWTRSTPVRGREPRDRDRRPAASNSVR